MSGVLNPRSRDELSRARVALVDKITELCNNRGWPDDVVLVASVLAALREDTEAGDKAAMALARRLPGRSVAGGGQFDVAEWIALLRRAEAMDAVLAGQGSGGVVATPGSETWVVVERPGQRLIDGMDRIRFAAGGRA